MFLDPATGLETDDEPLAAIASAEGGRYLTSMTNSPISPCLWFDDQAEAAAERYVASLPSATRVREARYPVSAENPGGRPPGSVMTVEVELGSLPFTLLNGGPIFRINPSISFFVLVDAAARADALWADLADGGQALMPLGAYPWSERYGWVQDRFGVSWQIMTGARATGGREIVPCFLFSGPQHGRAAEAMEAWASIFPGSKVASVERYASGEGPEQTVKHGRFLLRGVELVAMDSHLAHDTTFNEAVSLQVSCADQDEVDYYWDALSQGGRKGPCGWLTDRFGVSWQIVPDSIAQWMASDDHAARDRAYAAMMSMTKPDIAALRAAFSGG